MLSAQKSEVRSRKSEERGSHFFWILISVFCLLTSAQSQSVSLAAVGDVLLDRGVATQLRAHGTDYPFQFVAPVLRSADVAFGNLECPIAERGQKVIKPYVFKADPAFAPCLNAAGFDILSLANNHALDCGRLGLDETMATLRQRQIRWVGAGINRMQSEKATILKVRGLRVAFVGFCEFLPEGVFLNDEKTSIALADENRVRIALEKARSQSDVLIASFHWGVEYQNRPSARQKLLARVAAKAGADLVLGHHPHVLQGVEILPRGDKAARGRKTVVAYSLGNFLFDAPSRWAKETRDSAIFRCTFDKTGVRSAEFVPMIIEDCRPRPARGAQATALQARLSKLCAELGTKLKQGRVLLPATKGVK